jgi:hypothetical protein
MPVMNRIPIILAIMVLPVAGCLAQQPGENLTGEYINGVFYYKRLDYMRESYDRWRMIMDEYHPGEDVRKYNYGIYSAMNDFNFGRDVDTTKITPMLIGYAFGKNKLGYYFLLSTSDFRNIFRKEVDRSAGYFNGVTLGLSYQIKWFSLLADVTYASKSLSVYGKLFLPGLKTHFGVGTSRFDEVVDPVDQQKRMVKSKVLNPDQFTFATSIVPYFNVGLRLLRYTRVRYVPNISLALHQYIRKERWAEMKWDAELFLETRGEKTRNILKMEDYDVRLTLYRLLGEPLVKEDGICLRWAVFGGVSYKSELDYFAQTLTESGKVYTGQHGVGFEAGTGLRVLGFKKYGFQEDTYVRFSYFYNYSNYFERYPGMKQGLKFKVMF